MELTPPAIAPGAKGGAEPSGQGPASIPSVIGESVLVDLVGAPAAHGVRVIFVVAAPQRRRGDQRRPLAGAEVDLEVGIGELGEVVEGGGEGAVGRVGDELARGR